MTPGQTMKMEWRHGVQGGRKGECQSHSAIAAWFLLSISSPSTEMLAMYSFANGRLVRTVAMIEAYTGPVQYNDCVNSYSCSQVCLRSNRHLFLEMGRCRPNTNRACVRSKRVDMHEIVNSYLNADHLWFVSQQRFSKRDVCLL